MIDCALFDVESGMNCAMFVFWGCICGKGDIFG